MNTAQIPLPYLGVVKAGFPTFEEQGNNLLSLEEYLIENIHASFMTKLQNNNLRSIGILKGDLIIVERRARVNTGEIVLVITDNHHIFLQSELYDGKIILKSFINGSIHTDEVQVVGVIKGVIRKY